MYEETANLSTFWTLVLLIPHSFIRDRFKVIEYKSCKGVYHGYGRWFKHKELNLISRMYIKLPDMCWGGRDIPVMYWPASQPYLGSSRPVSDYVSHTVGRVPKGGMGILTDISSYRCMHSQVYLCSADGSAGIELGPYVWKLKFTHVNAK